VTAHPPFARCTVNAAAAVLLAQQVSPSLGVTADWGSITEAARERLRRDALEILAAARLPLRRGQVDADVQILTGAQARAEVPDLFEVDTEDVSYFNDLGAHGNAHWGDYEPDLVAVVRTRDGRVLMASNASDWHLTALGYEVPTDEDQEAPRG
jgi:hypothetical protein